MITALADEVARQLATAVLPQPVLPERTNLPRIDREKLTSLRTIVSPRRRSSERLSRDSFLRSYVIDVGLIAPVQAEANDETDPLVALGEAIVDWFERHYVLQVYRPGYSEAVRCVVVGAVYGDESSPIFDRESAESSNAFMAVVSLTIQVAE